jgi:hypothetical protein
LAESKYKISKGLAHLVITGEPVFVNDIYTMADGGEYANVVRPVVTQNGIEHRTETFPTAQLETRHKQAKRNIEYEQFIQSLREEAENKRYALTRGMKEALQSATPKPQNPSQTFYGNGDING